MPAKKPLPPEVYALWKSLYGNRTLYEIGTELIRTFPDEFRLNGGFVDARSAYIRCYRAAMEPALDQMGAAAISRMPEPQVLPSMLRPLIVPYKDCVVISDAHIPFHIEELFGDSLLFAKAHKIRRVVLNGDFLDFLFFSSYENLAKEKLEETWLAAARAFEAMFDHGVSEVLYNAGNHEHRYERKSGVPVMAMLAHIIDQGLAIAPGLGNAIKKRVRMTNMFWQRHTDTPDGIDWSIEHQWNHRQVRGSTASALAANTTECHTLTGHEHHYAMQLAPNARYYAVSCPTMQDADNAEYMVRRKRVGNKQCEGFAWIMDGCPGLWSHRDPEPAKVRRIKAKAVL